MRRAAVRPLRSAPHAALRATKLAAVRSRSLPCLPCRGAGATFLLSRRVGASFLLGTQHFIQQVPCYTPAFSCEGVSLLQVVRWRVREHLRFGARGFLSAPIVGRSLTWDHQRWRRRRWRGQTLFSETGQVRI